MTYNTCIGTDIMLSEFAGKLRGTGGVRQADRHDEASSRLLQLCERTLKLR
jgi:hypothetical protein